MINQLDYTHKKQEILNRFKDIIDELPLETDILTEIDRTLESHIATLKDTPERLLDALKSSGENFNAQIIAAYNNEQGVLTIYLSPQDAGIIVTDDPGNAQILESSYDKIKEIRNTDKKLLFRAFWLFRNGAYRDIPRGGSDITGAIVARGVKADLYENFTDVSGIFRANPSVIKHPEVIHKITYREMRELSYAGFGVFHDEALQPLYRYRIPVVIKIRIAQVIKGHILCTTVKSTMTKSCQVLVVTKALQVLTLKSI